MKPMLASLRRLAETDVQVIFGIQHDFESSRLEWNLDPSRERLRGSLMPIAYNSGRNLFVLSRRDAGAVNYLDLEAVYGDLEATAPEYPVAADLDELLSRLREL